MCDLNGPFKLCTCSSEIDRSKPHWVLYRNVVKEGMPSMVVGMPIFTINLIGVIQERKLLRRMNTRNVFDFDYNPKESDKLFIYFDKDLEDYIELEFINGKWKKIGPLGMHSENKHDLKTLGIIESKTSKLMQTYKKYLSVLSENEEDITIQERPLLNNTSEKDLIELLETRIKKGYKGT